MNETTGRQGERSPRPRVLVSACLLGCPCRYDGASKSGAAVLALSERCELIPVCPEQLGGLPTPRPSAERRGQAVVTENGIDVTEAYRRGAERALALCRAYGCRYAVLKARSPSCGKGRIYDGSFTRTLTDGSGVTTEMLARSGVIVLDETECGQIP